MLTYSFKLALLSLKERLALSILAVVAIAIGIGVLMTMRAQAYQGLRLPLGKKSLSHYLVQLDNREATAPEFHESYLNNSLAYRDAVHLVHADTPATRSTMSWRSLAVANSVDQIAQPLRAVMVAGDRNFFRMFQPPFQYGGPWSDKADYNAEPVVVISRKFNDHFFNGDNSVGRQLNIDTASLTVVGVMDDWHLSRLFYARGFYPGIPVVSDDLFVPHSVAAANAFQRIGGIGCWSNDNSRIGSFRTRDIEGLMNSECGWINLWVELSSNIQVDRYRNYLSQYVSQQKELGRFPRPENNLLNNPKQLSEEVSGLNGRFSLMNTLANLFFFVCLANTIGILLAKFMSKTKEVSLRRALGAKKRSILLQYLMEVSIIGVIAGCFGLVIAWLGLRGQLQITIWKSDYQWTYSDVAHNYQLDWVMMVTAISIALISTIVVGLYPLWRICNTEPAAQLKAQ